MNEYFVILLFIVWYGLSLIVSERYGKEKKPGVEWLFFISMIFSPIVGFLVGIIYQKAGVKNVITTL